MKKDRFLTGILIFIAVLVVVAVALFFLRDRGQAYGPEDTPGGVLKNYALAIQNMDYERAYSYLADWDNKPTYKAFRQVFLARQLDMSNTTLQIGNAYRYNAYAARVEVFVLSRGSGLFDTDRSHIDKGTLILQNGAWKINYLPYPYWRWYWYTPRPSLAPGKP